jgi:hypothetical protein
MLALGSVIREGGVMFSYRVTMIAILTMCGAATVRPAVNAQQQSGPPLAPAADKLSIPEGEVALGTVRLPISVVADGGPLRPGTYRLRLTGEAAKPAVVGHAEKLERWVEFLQGSDVKGRAVASIVPGSAIRRVAESAPPRPGRSRVDRLKGDDYLRVWFNKGGDHVLLHLAIAGRTS